MGLAVEHPELIRTLVLAEPGMAATLDTFTPTLAETDASQRFAAALQRALASDDAASVVTAFFDYVAPGTVAALLHEVRDMLLWNAAAVRVERASARPPVRCGDLGRVAIPTLLVVGDRSPTSFRRSAEALTQCLPQSALATIPDAGHMMLLENAEAFNEAVLAFLSGS